MGSSVSTDANVVTVIDATSTDEQVPSALATKAYVDNNKECVEITQAEYDLLTEEEKEGIVFYIKDAVSDNRLVTVIDATSTDEEIPSAKAVYNEVKALRDAITELTNRLDSL